MKVQTAGFAEGAEMRLRKTFLFSAFSAFSAALLAFPAQAQMFNKAQERYMSADPNSDESVHECEEGAATRMQYLYHMFRPEGTIPACEPGKQPCACKPQWLDAELPEMFKKPVWQDPNEGVLSEAAIWQGPIAVLYEFFTILQKTYPQDDGGQGQSPTQLMREFADNSTRFTMAVDRLKRARLGASMDGRGRALLSDLELIASEYSALMDGLIRSDVPAFRTSALAIADLCHMLFRELYRKPRGGTPPKDESTFAVMPVLLSAVSVFLVFLAGLQFGTLNQGKIGDWIDQYMAASKNWANEFNRQFVTIKVHYLVLGPWLFMTIVGVSTLNIGLMLFFSTLGLIGGLKIPGMVVDMIRIRRGLRVEAQLIDALTLLGNGLKSGLDLVKGFNLVAKEMLPPISEEFGLVIKNFELGMPFARALEGLEDRIQSRLLSYLVKAIVIQQQVGGNIIKIFDRIVENIREESKLEQKTAALTAQQKIQSIVVGTMPWVMLGIMFLFQRKQMADFYGNPLGLCVLIFCAIWIAIGMKIVSSLGDIKV
jgi:tight adherence protein B